MKNKTIDISIIIPVYGVEEYIIECLQSVAEQININDISIECLVIDDCGKDKSLELCKNFVNNYLGQINFKIIEREKNGGLSAARNTGIKNSAGKYVYFLDSDDSIAPHCIQSLWSSVTQYPNVDIVYGIMELNPKRYDAYYDISKKGAINFSNNRKHILDIHLDLPVMACNKLIRREWINDNQLLFKEGIINEDNEWHLRHMFLLKSYAFKSENPPTYIYRQREDSIMGKMDPKSEEKSIRMFQFAIDFIPTIEIWNRGVLNFVLNNLLSLKYNYKNIAFEKNKTLYQQLCYEIKKNKNISLWQKFIVCYAKWPWPIMRYKVLNFLKRL